MPDWLAVVTGWICLLLGCLGLWRGIGLVRPGRTATQDSTATPGALVVAEGGGLALLGVALLLGGYWVYLFVPAMVLMAVSTVHAISRWRRRRCSSRSSR
ncbi:hypothetical protein [Actinoplanes solisilvae]|uniref:hypothetical protein n=1 Tax=Actinoplanes solisilvae TaxID=2486853 RepID=UPI000FDAC452|nr:hypothetical protein [Actinoplanes solisilvae]